MQLTLAHSVISACENEIRLDCLYDIFIYIYIFVSIYNDIRSGHQTWNKPLKTPEE